MGHIAGYVSVVPVPVLSAVAAGLIVWGSLFLVIGKLRGSSLEKKLRFEEPKERINNLSPQERNALAGTGVGAVIMGLLAWNTGWAATAAAAGGLVGYFVVKLFQNIRKDSELQNKRKEITLYFEAVEMYLRARLSMPYTLSSAKIVAPSLTKAVNACLALWSSDSARALEAMRREMNLPEADIVVSLLAQINKAGVDSLQGMIRREAQNLERLREVSVRTKISSRPVFFVVYRILPLLAVFGMVAGTLYWKLGYLLKGVGLDF